MSELLVHKFVDVLPASLDPNSIYFVKKGLLFELYVTNSVGTIIAHKLSAETPNKQTPYIIGVTEAVSNRQGAVVVVTGSSFEPTTIFNLESFGGSIVETKLISPNIAELTLNTTDAGDYVIGASSGSVSNADWFGGNIKTLKVNKPIGTGVAGENLSNFEDNTFGSWVNTGQNNYRINQGNTPSSGTGATGSNTGSRYMYSEVSSPVVNGSTFIIQTSDFREATKIEYAIHRYSASGNSMGQTLLQYTNDGVTWNTIKQYTNNLQNTQGQAYTNESIDLTPYDITALRFVTYKGTTGVVWRGDVCIDDIKITSI